MQLVYWFLGSIDCEETGTVILEQSFTWIEGYMVTWSQQPVRIFGDLMVAR
jgi:hypothetical protein